MLLVTLISLCMDCEWLITERNYQKMFMQPVHKCQREKGGYNSQTYHMEATYYIIHWKLSLPSIIYQLFALQKSKKYLSKRPKLTLNILLFM